MLQYFTFGPFIDRVLDRLYELECYMYINQQVAQLSQRDRASGWISNGQKWKTGTERQYLRTI